MLKLMKLKRQIAADNGATAVEYGLIIGLIAVVIIAAVTLLGTSISNTFGDVACKVQGKTVTVNATTGVHTCA